MQLKVGEECCSTNLQSHYITVLQNYNIYYEYINKYITIYIYFKYILKVKEECCSTKVQTYHLPNCIIPTHDCLYQTVTKMYNLHNPIIIINPLPCEFLDILEWPPKWVYIFQKCKQSYVCNMILCDYKYQH